MQWNDKISTGKCFLGFSGNTVKKLWKLSTCMSSSMRMMELLSTHPTDCEFQSVIHFLRAKGVEPLDIHCEISFVSSSACVTIQMVCCWIKAFNKGRTEVYATPHLGRPHDAANEIVVRNSIDTVSIPFGIVEYQYLI